ncbi:MAG: molecular chaperone DnaJ [Alphaproteobacteria bacterium]|nr:molecular chaperone DnaJ [Alphaproteobacteria bacterium]
MGNVIGFGEMRGGAANETVCWLCMKSLSPRVIFCHSCGAIQPVRNIDHFTRLALERRIDINQETLERQYAAMKKTFDPQRFAIRGATERGHAAKQLEALTEAYETLREPVRRGRYWLGLHEQEFEESQAGNPVVQEMKIEFDHASSAGEVDRVARKAGQHFEEGVMRLLQSLRQQNWQLANATLVELDGMEGILNEVRGKRTQITDKKDG